MRFQKFLIAVALIFSGCGEEKIADAPPKTDPTKRAKMDTTGLTAKSASVALGSNDRIYWKKALASGVDKAASTQFPAKVTRFKAEPRCGFPAPAEGTVVKVVNLLGSKSATSIFPTTPELLAKNTERLLDRSGNKVLMVLGKTAIVNPYEMVDVIVTEKSAPLHLVLASADQVIWNFSLAEGVEISNVTLLGRQDVGVVNLPETVNVSAFNGKNLTKCKVVPAAVARTDWPLAKRSKEVYGEYKARAARFSHWLSKTHRSAESLERIDGLAFSAVLIGPAPTTLEARVPYNGIGQGHVRIVSNAPIEIMEREAYARKIKAIAKAKAEQFAGMTLAEHGRAKDKKR